MDNIIKSGIYKIVNLVNYKIYVGSAFNLKERFRSHRNELRRKVHVNIPLQNAWNKYGEENFKFEILEKVSDITKLLEREQFYLDMFKCFADADNGYNILKIAGSRHGMVHSEEAKKLISIASTGRFHTAETRHKISVGHKGIRHTLEIIAKIKATKLLHPPRKRKIHLISNELFEQYAKEGLTLPSIARKFNIEETTARTYFKTFLPHLKEQLKENARKAPRGKVALAIKLEKHYINGIK